MKKRIYFDLLIIFLLGLLPILWLPGQTLLLGHDSGMTFDPITHLLDRLHVWTQRLGIGTDQSAGLLGAIVFIHGLEALLVWVGFSMQWMQKLQFVFWFVTPGLAMYYFVHKTWSDKKYLPLIASVIYMLNFFLIQAWFVAERTKFSIYVALPLIIYFTFGYLSGKISYKKSIIATGLIIGFFNAGGSFPLYGGLILAILSIFLYEYFLHFGREIIKKTILFSLGVGVIYALLNAFWLFTYLYYIFGFYNRDLALAGGPQGSLAWSEYLAKGSTFINLFRGQGVPEWYLNPYHAFASNFLTNPILILASFAFPVLAYLSLFFAKLKKDKYYIYIFVVMSLVALFFSAGPRSQLGSIYEFIAIHTPGFAIFRSNFYKFGYLLWFSYAVLIGFSLDVIFSKIENFLKSKKFTFNIISLVLPIVFVLAYVLYHYPVLTGSFLDYSSEPGKELTTRVTVPQYIFDFGKWANAQDPNKRYLVVPEISDTGFIAYQWRYWSLASINSLLTKNSFVQNTFMVQQSERLLMKQMYSALLREDMKSFTDFTEVFAIDGIVVHEDFDWKNPAWATTNPLIYTKILDNNKNFKLAQTFGKWKVYDIVGRNESLRVTATPRLNFLQGDLQNVVSFPDLDPRTPLFMADLEPASSEYFASQATDIFVAPGCIQCDLKKEDFGFNFYNPKVLPGSVIYPLVLYRESLIKKRSKDFSSLLNYQLTVSDRRIVEAKWMVDSKEKIQFLQRAVDGYYKSMKELNALVSKQWGVTGAEENRLARTINGHLIQQVTLIDSIFENPMLNIEHRRVLAITYEELLKVKKIADKKQWVTDEITDKRYILDLPKTGTYDVFVKRKSLSDPRADASSSTISFADSDKLLKPISEKNDWLYFGGINFESKQARLAIKDATLKNLLDGITPQFPDGNFGITQDKNKFYLNLDSQNKCLTYQVNNLETIESQYLVSFSYRNLTDKKDLSFYISSVKENTPKLHIRETFVANSRTWVTYTQVVSPVTTSMKLNLCNNFVSISQKGSLKEREDLKFLTPGQNLIEIQDVGVYKISRPTILLYQKQKSTIRNDYVSDFQKISPEEYAINLKETKDPVTLVMRENFGKFWQLCDENKKCLSFDDKNHFAAGGFSNGWYFKDGIKGKISLYYYPQKTYIIGAYITIVSLVIIIGGICWTKLRKK